MNGIAFIYQYDVFTSGNVFQEAVILLKYYVNSIFGRDETDFLNYSDAFIPTALYKLLNPFSTLRKHILFIQ